MNQRNIVFLLALFCTVNSFAQETKEIPDREKERKNAILITVFPILYNTISLSYNRKLKNSRHELTFNPRVRIASSNHRDNKNFSGFNDDPGWYYNYYMLRSGFMIRLGERVYCEPQIQGVHGFFKNQVLVTDNAYDKYVRSDRQYNSIGFVFTLTSIRDVRGVRLKSFIGVGMHKRWYQETQYAQYELTPYWSASFVGYPKDLSFTRIVTSFHLGIEVGLPF